MESNKKTKAKTKLEQFKPVQEMTVNEALEYITFLMNNLNYIINVIPNQNALQKKQTKKP